ncbi:MAG TPA: iron-sulfur cluster repair di-iron protein [Vicinamibacterales bacterium]|nr:iron-sulfur cluster repair di-iron protein [Vicinamibacterales bacterium]HJO37378.1 iron-sulfur cluster repair di-iron protein [Vicinamibacterales bacterium]|tara:strand:- start:1673 stop:2344 length:672 start_codon:yes stop_codon:yes gene_type:complete
MTITSGMSVGTLAAEHPLATRVFARHGIDYCCRGGRPLGEVCAEERLDTDAVLDEIRRELETADASEVRWDQAPLGDLIDHILATYHRSLDEELPRLESMARKVLDVHRDKDPERLPELLSVFLGLKSELEEHMAKEEQILFPLIRSGRGAMAGGPIAAMEHDHASAGAVLRRLQELTDGYEVPAGACNTWRALWHGLAALEESLHQHIHLENNILFPRALAG